MASKTTDDAVALLRHALAARTPKPTRAFRRRAWRAFEQALDRHLAASGAPERIMERPR